MWPRANTFFRYLQKNLRGVAPPVRAAYFAFQLQATEIFPRIEIFLCFANIVMLSVALSTLTEKANRATSTGSECSVIQAELIYG